MSAETTRAPLLAMTEKQLLAAKVIQDGDDFHKLLAELDAQRTALAAERERAERLEARVLELKAVEAHVTRQWREQQARIERLERDLADLREAIEIGIDTASEDIIKAERARAERAEQDAARLRAALEKYVEWHGGAHEPECPADDTCDCAGAPVNTAVNAALASPDTETR